MKTFDKKDVYSWSNAEEAKQYIGKVGYFADNVDDLQECVNNDNFQTLFSIDLDPQTDVDSIFSITEIDYKYALFIPAEKVKEVEEKKKYRSFKSIDEFFTTLEVELGQSIVLRHRLTPKEKLTVVFTGYIEFDNKLTYIMLGNLEYSPSAFYNSYEVYNDNTKTWQPFGVEE